MLIFFLFFECQNRYKNDLGNKNDYLKFGVSLQFSFFLIFAPTYLFVSLYMNLPVISRQFQPKKRNKA